MLFLLRMLAPICIAVAAAFIMSIYTSRYLNAAGLLLCVCVCVFGSVRHKNARQNARLHTSEVDVDELPDVTRYLLLVVVVGMLTWLQ